MTTATQLQILRAAAARDLETWRGILANAETSIARTEEMLLEIDGLLADVEEQGDG